ncbi:ferritin-like domain-containing protein [Mycena sp. CBHHK59/15]|nr:ferritin-like domain-containing protein [Mycena sp. CBHHK59/15]KAJ6625332.1 ferritin-like domain-containing protein [Mycena sp. CBHHK59/15]
MKYSVAASALAVFSLANIVSALPAKRGVSDPQVLNFALTLEHLEAKFYQEGMSKFSQADFVAAHYGDWVRGRFEQIAAHEQTHVDFLTTALTAAGAKPVEACEYNFGVTDVKSFVDLSAILEAVGATAYTGAAQFIENKDYLTVAASILTVEGRHEAWVNSAVRESSAWDTAFQTALTPNQVYSLAVPFIKSCPSSNAASLFALTAYPGLTIADAHPGKTATLTFPAQPAGSKFFAAFISGVSAPMFVPVTDGNKVAVPDGLRGFVFCVLTNDGSKVDDSTTVAGPAILNFAFDSRGELV